MLLLETKIKKLFTGTKRIESILNGLKVEKKLEQFCNIILADFKR